MADDLSLGGIRNPFMPDVGPSDEKPNVAPIPTTGEAAGTFKDTVKSLLGDVNEKLLTSEGNMQDLAVGRTNDIQKVVTSVEEANLALQYTMAIRQKLLDAYQEVSRMQV